MTLTRRARAAWPIVGAAIVLAGGAAAVASAQPSATPPTASPVLEGRVLTEDGAPVAGASVDALTSRFASGRRTLVAAGTVQTNQQGEFRLANLAPGRYFIAASAPSASAGAAERYAPTYYPGVSSPDDARVVPVAGGSSPARIEFRLKLVPLARVSGRLSTVDARPLLSGTVAMTPEADNGAPAFVPSDVRINADGTFTFGRVPPGHYRIRARGQTAANGPALFAIFNVIVDGSDLEGVILSLRPGGTLDGRVSIDPAHRGQPPALSGLRVRAPLTDGTPFGDPWTGKVGSDGRFALQGVMAGEHQIVVDDLPPGWIIHSVLVAGREVVDLGVRIDEGQQLRDAHIVLTDRAAIVSGRVSDSAGRGADVPVLVYPAAPQLWRASPRRLRIARTDAGGRFTITGLPDGDYLAVACAEIDDGAETRGSLLEALRTTAATFTVSGPDAHVSVEVPLLAALPGEPVPTR